MTANIPKKFTTIVLILAHLLLAACAAGSVPSPDSESGKTTYPVSSTPSAVELTPTAAPTTVELPTPEAATIWLAPYLPSDLLESAHLPADLSQVDQPDSASLRVEVGAEHILSTWVYVLAAPFPTVPDEVSSADLKAAWSGAPPLAFPATHLWVSSQTYDIFSALWGKPANFVKKAPEKSLLDSAYQEKSGWALIPFEQTQPRWKVIAVDGLSPIQKSFTTQGYALVVPFSLEGPEPTVSEILTEAGPASAAPMLAAANRDPQKMTTLILTGVTALVRATDATMQIKGNTYPGEEIRAWLREADFTHINNEVPFAKNCPRTFDPSKGLVFCSRPETIELLEDIGTDIIELAGDHFQDWGSAAMLYTLDLYDKEGWKYYGGGKNAEEANQPVLLEHNGNKIALLGCNAKSPGYAVAKQNTPGAVHCDMAKMSAEVKKLVALGYLPVFTFQHEEVWTYKADPALQPDFRAAADAGAVIVSGSQAHQPQAFELRGNSFIHYGLGNLFFDQYNEGLPNRQAFIDRHVFYDGRYISTELLTIMFVDYAHPRPMTPDERSELLKTIFDVSLWQGGTDGTEK